MENSNEAVTPNLPLTLLEYGNPFQQKYFAVGYSLIKLNANNTDFNPISYSSLDPDKFT